MRALHTAATGMMAQELNVQVISNNIANMRTTGYKCQRAEFQDLLYEHVSRIGTQTSAQGNTLPVGIDLGGGVKTVGTPRLMTQGTLSATGSALDVAIRGDVERGAGCRQRALRHQARRADGLDAAAEIDADRKRVALRRGLRADAADVLVQQILEFDALALVAGGAHVGDVVGDYLDVEFLGHHSSRRGMKCAHGFRSPRSLIRDFR